MIFGGDGGVYVCVAGTIRLADEYMVKEMGSMFEEICRQDVYEILPVAIRELIINAAVYRSYLNHRDIQVGIYDDYLEVTSPVH